MTRIPPRPGLHHGSAGLDAAVHRLADRAEGREPAVLPMPRTADLPPVVLLCRLIHAIRVGDFREATRIRRELNARWDLNVLTRPGCRAKLIEAAEEAAAREGSASAPNPTQADDYQRKGPAAGRVAAGPTGHTPQCR